MAMREQSINIDIKPMNEQAPKSAGPMGRLARIENGVAKKFLGDSLRVSKRPGSTSLSATTFNNGSVTTSPENPKSLASWKDQLLLIGGTTPYVYSEARVRWEMQSVSSVPRSVATQTITKRPLYSANTKAYAPDVAAVGDVLAWIVHDNTIGARVLIQDAKGVQIRPPFVTQGTGTTSVAKVVSDGTQFWVFSQSTAATDTFVQVFDTDGAQLATTTIAWGAARRIWDVGFSTAVFLVTSTGATTTVYTMVYTLGTILLSAPGTPAIDSTLGLARIENTQGGTFIYISAVAAGGNVTPYELTSAGAINHTYAVAYNSVDVKNIAGYVVNSSRDVRLAISVLIDNTIDSLAGARNHTEVQTVTYSGSVTSLTKLGFGVVSRAYVDDIGVWRVVVYYLSTACWATVGAYTDVSQLGAQPTFFVLDLSSVPGIIVGQFDTGFAYAFYATSRNSVVFTPWHLSSIAADLSGVQHIPLGALGIQSVLPSFYGFVAATTLEDVSISARVGRSLSTSDGLMIPGLEADDFDGTTVEEWGLRLAPEIITQLASGVGGLTAGETYTYVAVYEWTDGQGILHQSALSEPQEINTAAATKVTLTVSSLRQTLKPNVVIALYRTFSPAPPSTTQGVILRLVSRTANDLTTNTVTIADVVADTDAELGQELYSQPLNTNAPVALDFFPPPAFSKGINFGDRQFLIGYDKAIWFSFPKTEGQGIAFNPFFRILLPTAATPKDLVALDGRVAVFCDDGSQWSFPAGNLPNATLTSGAVPTPEQVPATTGATSAALLTPMGAIFGAITGPWLMDRGLQSKYIGAPVIDEVDTTTQVVSIDADAYQRLYFALGTDGDFGTLQTVLSYDLVSNCWYVWTMPETVYATAQWKGRYAFVDGAAVVHVMDPDETTGYTDDGDAILSVYELASIDFAGVNGYESVWQVQFYGSYLGPHTLSIQVKYDQADTVTETFTEVITVDPGIYRFEVMPTNIDCQAIGLTFSDSFPGAPGNSFALEAIGLLVGVESGLGRISPTTRRIAP